MNAHPSRPRSFRIGLWLPSLLLGVALLLSSCESVPESTKEDNKEYMKKQQRILRSMRAKRRREARFIQTDTSQAQWKYGLIGAETSN